MSDIEQNETVETEMSELDSLKAKAELIGLKFHPSITADKLRAKIAAKLADEDTEEEDKSASTRETPGQAIKRMKDEAMALVRVNITCMNPAKREWNGEILAVGNSHLPTIKKFIPFNTVDGYHIPKIMYDMLKARQCQVFFNERQSNGITVRKGKLINEFAIEILPPLTKEELAELAKVQAAAGVIA